MDKIDLIKETGTLSIPICVPHNHGWKHVIHSYEIVRYDTVFWCEGFKFCIGSTSRNLRNIYEFSTGFKASYSLATLSDEDRINYFLKSSKSGGLKMGEYVKRVITNNLEMQLWNLTFLI